MNRYDKEQLRHFMRENITKLDEFERAEFAAFYGSHTDKNPLETISNIQNKQLRHAYKYVAHIVKRSI